MPKNFPGTSQAYISPRVFGLWKKSQTRECGFRIGQGHPFGLGDSSKSQISDNNVLLVRLNTFYTTMYILADTVPTQGALKIVMRWAHS